MVTVDSLRFATGSSLSHQVNSPGKWGHFGIALKWKMVDICPCWKCLCYGISNRIQGVYKCCIHSINTAKFSDKKQLEKARDSWRLVARKSDIDSGGSRPVEGRNLIIKER